MYCLCADEKQFLPAQARIETQNHRFTYDEPMTVESCTQAICDYALQFGEEGAP
jgi:20S proteasome subunit alpha 5